METHAVREDAVDKDLKDMKLTTLIPDSLLEALSALEMNLVNSEIFLRFKDEERKLDNDQKAGKLMSDFSELQQKIRSQHNAGAVSETDIKLLRKLQGDIGTNSSIQQYTLAQKEAAGFVKEINQVISNLLGIDFASLTRHSSGCC